MVNYTCQFVMKGDSIDFLAILDPYNFKLWLIFGTCPKNSPAFCIFKNKTGQKQLLAHNYMPQNFIAFENRDNAEIDSTETSFPKLG